MIFNHSSSQILCAIVLNFASTLDLATISCFLLFQVTRFLPRKVQYLVVDLLSTIDPALYTLQDCVMFQIPNHTIDKEENRHADEY